MSIAIEQCLELLPQTQCQECGHPGCLPYATALIKGTEPSIARCLPGGQQVADALALLFGRESELARPVPAPLVAKINVEDCIGCSLCIKACPVDTIWGAQGFEHQVWEQDCTACGLCLPACPTGCITMDQRTANIPLPSPERNLEKIASKQQREQKQRESKWEAHRNALKKK